MPQAARVGDFTSHGGVVVGPNVPTVLIGGLPAAVLGDVHVCGVPLHPASPEVPFGTVLIGGRPAAKFGDVCGCGAQIISGAFNVLIEG